MPESFENQLSQKIRSTFENYNEPFNNDAWELMQEKLVGKKKKKSFIFFINIAKAASIVLFVGIGVLWPFKTNHQFSNSDKSFLMDDNNQKEDSTVNEKNEFIIADENINEKIENHIDNYKTIINNNKEESYISDNEIDINANKIIFDSSITEENHEKKIYADIIDINKNDTAKNKIATDTIKDNRPILLPDDKDFFIKKRSDKKFNFGIAVSSHYSSSEIGATDNINIGGGVQAEYAISDLISFSSGVLVANHHMNTESSSLFGNFKSYDAVENTLASNTLAGSSETEVLLVGLDIPLNVKLNFDKMYISTGVSSLFYLKESYSENYYIENTQEVYNNSTNRYETLYLYDNVNESQQKGAFKTFDFAKLFNFSVGYKIPLKKGKVIFEPYMKIPIGNLTSYSISYGYGGLALKYDF